MAEVVEGVSEQAGTGLVNYRSVVGGPRGAGPGPSRCSIHAVRCPPLLSS